MRDLNSVQLIGRLGQDPEVQYSDTGTARTTFSVATNRTWTDADGQAQTETEWTRCTTWGKLAEIAAQFAHRGSRVYVAGRLHTSDWDDAQTGEARAGVEIVVDDLILLDRPTRAVTLEDEHDAREPQAQRVHWSAAETLAPEGAKPPNVASRSDTLLPQASLM